MIDLLDFKCFSFAGGERHFNSGVGLEDEISLMARLSSSDHIMDLLLVTEFLKSKSKRLSNLVMPYVPYARQDRRTTNQSPYSLSVFADLINNLGYEKVHMYEPHSEITPALIKNSVVHTFDRAAISFINEFSKNDAILLAPDHGAVKRVFRVSEQTNLPFMVANKIRDPATGKLHITDIFGLENHKTAIRNGKPVIVLDDICDGGATFNQLGDYIYDLIPNVCLFLFVAHGIFSKGMNEIYKYYSVVGTTDSFVSINDNIIKRYPSIEIQDL